MLIQWFGIARISEVLEVKRKDIVFIEGGGGNGPEVYGKECQHSEFKA